MLKKANKQEYIVPCYDIDLIWHTHQVHHANYANDTKAFLGYIFPHDDSTNDRSEGSVLSNAYAKTIKMWSETFKESYPRPGAMFRGCHPFGKLAPISQALLDDMTHCKESKMTIKRVHISG